MLRTHRPLYILEIRTFISHETELHNTFPLHCATEILSSKVTNGMSLFLDFFFGFSLRKVTSTHASTQTEHEVNSITQKKSNQICVIVLTYSSVYFNSHREILNHFSESLLLLLRQFLRFRVTIAIPTRPNVHSFFCVFVPLSTLFISQAVRAFIYHLLSIHLPLAYSSINSVHSLSFELLVL